MYKIISFPQYSSVRIPILPTQNLDTWCHINYGMYAEVPGNVYHYPLMHIVDQTHSFQWINFLTPASKKLMAASITMLLKHSDSGEYYVINLPFQQALLPKKINSLDCFESIQTFFQYLHQTSTSILAIVNKFLKYIGQLKTMRHSFSSKLIIFDVSIIESNDSIIHDLYSFILNSKWADALHESLQDTNIITNSPPPPLRLRVSYGDLEEEHYDLDDSQYTWGPHKINSTMDGPLPY